MWLYNRLKNKLTRYHSYAYPMKTENNTCAGNTDWPWIISRNKQPNYPPIPEANTSVSDTQRLVGITQIILGIATVLIALPAASSFLLKKSVSITADYTDMCLEKLRHLHESINLWLDMSFSLFF
jgi:hypothetical protein